MTTMKGLLTLQSTESPEVSYWVLWLSHLCGICWILSLMLLILWNVLLHTSSSILDIHYTDWEENRIFGITIGQLPQWQMLEDGGWLWYQPPQFLLKFPGCSCDRSYMAEMTAHLIYSHWIENWSLRGQPEECHFHVPLWTRDQSLSHRSIWRMPSLSVGAYVENHQFSLDLLMCSSSWLI